MAVGDLSELFNALQQCSFDDVNGTPECSWVDFKQSPYHGEPDNPQHLATRSKFEFAKDVAAFLNDQGGCLVLGYVEEKDPTRGVTVAKEVKHIPFVSVDIDHYKGVLDAHIYPVPRDVAFTWYPKEENSTEGVLTINVPSGNEGPYFVRHLYDETGSKIQGIGIPRRNDDRTNWYTPEKLHGMLTGGSTIASINTSSAPRQAEQSIVAKSITATAAKVRDSILEIQSWNDDPVILLQVVPVHGPARLDNFYDKIRVAIEQPKPIRPMGFGLGSLGRAVEAVDGSFVINGSRDTAARLDPNGQFTVALKVSGEFVGWGLNGRGQNSVNDSVFINANVIVEMTYELCRFVREYFVPNGLKNWKYIVDCRNLRQGSVMLAPGKPGLGWPSNSIANASSDQWCKEIETGEDASADAYKVLAELYALFALPDGDIPHAKDSKIIPQMIIDLNKNPY